MIYQKNSGYREILDYSGFGLALQNVFIIDSYIQMLLITFSNHVFHFPFFLFFFFFFVIYCSSLTRVDACIWCNLRNKKIWWLFKSCLYDKKNTIKQL